MAGPKHNDEKKMTLQDSFVCQVQEFDFCGESIDTSLRKLLAKVLLPKEAQQIDRAMEEFAKRYYECNPGLVDNPDVVYAVAFSILLLHTDAHNKNVKQKMNKDTFIMRTKIIEGGEGVAQEILDVMYDNIVMSEFTYADGHKESIGLSIQQQQNSWFSKLKSTASNDTINSSQLLNDLESKLKQLMPAENSFSFKRNLKPIPIMDIHFSLLKAKSICLAGVRSRYQGDQNNDNTFTIKVTKAGILDRKYDLIQGGKKATARGWRPFGVILSGSQIIFFADLTTFQAYMDKEALELPPKRNHSFPALSMNSSMNDNSMTSLYSTNTINTTQSPIPTTAYLRPVQIISLSYAICIYDETYKKYPHTFRLITGDGQQFLLRAENEADLEDWMLKINYASTLKTTGVKIRPIMTTKSNNSVERLKREEKAKEKITELSIRINEQVKLLERELQLRRNLMVLIPFKKETKDRIIQFADILGKRIKLKRIELQRLECYRDYLESELNWCYNNHQLRKLSLPLPTHMYTSAPNSTASSPISTLSSSIHQEEEEEEEASSPQIPAFSFPKSFIDSVADMDTTHVKQVSDKESEMDRIMRRRSQSNPILVDKKLLLLEPPKNRQRSGSEASSIKDDDDSMSVIIVNESDELLIEPSSSSS